MLFVSVEVRISLCGTTDLLPERKTDHCFSLESLSESKFKFLQPEFERFKWC